jgi:hypothetical protein
MEAIEVYPDAGRDVPPGATSSAIGSGEQEKLHGLLREATRLIEHSDLGLAIEKLREAGELAAGTAAREVRAGG